MSSAVPGSREPSLAFWESRRAWQHGGNSALCNYGREGRQRMCRAQARQLQHGGKFSPSKRRQCPRERPVGAAGCWWGSPVGSAASCAYPLPSLPQVFCSSVALASFIPLQRQPWGSTPRLLTQPWRRGNGRAGAGVEGSALKPPW